MVWRATVWPRPQEAHERDLSHTRATRGLDEIASALNMHSLKCLAANFAIDSRAVRHGIASSKGLRERCRIRKSHLDKVRLGKMHGTWIASVHTSGQQTQLAARRRRLPPPVAAYTGRSASECA